MKNKKLLYASSYDRGLIHLLDMWDEIRGRYPDATLDICYGWDTFLAFFRNNPERMKWKEMMIEKMNKPGITEHGRLSKLELERIRKNCGIWAYPTDFTEINCITALECQRDGCVPVVIDYCALKETVQSGMKIEGDIYDKRTRENYLNALLELMGDEKKWKSEIEKGKEFAKDYNWETISDKWIDVFNEEKSLPKVTLYTPTNRRGWEELMTKNIKLQTYRGEIEWLIIDDGEGDMKINGNGLDVKIIKGKHEGYKHGLSHANNIAMNNASGELLIILQDFIEMNDRTVEDMVNLYIKNKDCLIASVDVGLNKDGVEIYKNVRIANKGLRHTDNPYDFESNCGAIPMHILRHLNGWYELLDDGLGFDNTEIAKRALDSGYGIIIDETNVVKGHYHEPREHDDNQFKRYNHIITNLPTIRNYKLDQKLHI